MKSIFINARQIFILTAIFLSTGLFMSCEKAPLDTENTTDSQYSTEIKTELFNVESNMWIDNNNKTEYTYECEALKNSSNCKSIKLFIKTPIDHENPNLWSELPNGDVFYEVNSNTITIGRPIDWIKKDCIFKVELEVVNSNIPKTDYNHIRKVDRIDESRPSSYIIDDTL